MRIFLRVTGTAIISIVKDIEHLKGYHINICTMILNSPSDILQVDRDLRGYICCQSRR